MASPDEQDDTGIVEELVRKQLLAFIDKDIEAANKVAHPKFQVKEAEFDKQFQEQFALFGKDAAIEYCAGTYTEAPPGPPHFCAKMCLVQVKQNGGIGMIDYVKCQSDKGTQDQWTVAEWQQDPPEEESPKA